MKYVLGYHLGILQYYCHKRIKKGSMGIHSGSHSTRMPRWQIECGRSYKKSGTISRQQQWNRLQPIVNQLLAQVIGFKSTNQKSNVQKLNVFCYSCGRPCFELKAVYNKKYAQVFKKENPSLSGVEIPDSIDSETVTL